MLYVRWCILYTFIMWHAVFIYHYLCGRRRVAKSLDIQMCSDSWLGQMSRRQLHKFLELGLRLLYLQHWKMLCVATLSPIIMEVENGHIWKVTTIGGTHFPLPWVWEEGYTTIQLYVDCIWLYKHKSGQIIATSHDLTPNGGLVREFPLFQGNLGWWNIIIWPDKCQLDWWNLFFAHKSPQE